VSLRLPESRVIRVGLVLFVLGLAFVAVDIGLFWANDHNTPLWLNLCCLAAPAGFLIAVWTGLRQGRAEQRAALAALSEPPVAH
jgi:cyanate permease